MVNAFGFYTYNFKSISFSNTLKSVGQQAFYFVKTLEDIYYDGTTEQWKSLEFGMYWDLYTGDYIVHCLDGDISKAEMHINDPNYWA